MSSAQEEDLKAPTVNNLDEYIWEETGPYLLNGCEHMQETEHCWLKLTSERAVWYNFYVQIEFQPKYWYLGSTIHGAIHNTLWNQP